MTSKERLLKTINRQKPDRPAVYCSVVSQIAEKLCQHFNIEIQQRVDSPISSNRISWNDLMIRLGSDCVSIASASPDNAKTKTLKDGLIINEWGITMLNDGRYTSIKHHPLAQATSVEDVLKYEFPDVSAIGRFRHAQETIDKYGDKYAVIGNLESSILNTASFLVGKEKLFADMSSNEAYVDVLFDKIAQYHTQLGRQLALLGADIIMCGDDFSTPTGDTISCEIFDKYLSVKIARMFESIKMINPKVKIAWHSTGDITPLIPRFIKLGLDIINPIQQENKDFHWLKDTYGDDLIFFGGICVDNVLSNISTNQLKANVRRCIDILGENGGYILAPTNNIKLDTPIENIFAMFEAAMQ